MYTESEKNYISGIEAQTYVNLQCEHPYRVTTRQGVKISVPCGKCCACRSRRRASWSKRLADEASDFRNLHTFGFTLTYDSEHVPFLEKETLDYIKKNENDYDKINTLYIQPNKSHSYLFVNRGYQYSGNYKNINGALAYGDCVGICYSLDIDEYIRSFRRELVKAYYKFFHNDNVAKRDEMEEFCDLVPRYYIISDYGELDSPVNAESKKRMRTGRPHYHGIMYIHAKTEEKAMEIRKIPNLLNSIAVSCENIALNSWKHCKRFWDAKKQIWAGKSIQTFGQNWGDYLGRYINKEENACFSGALGDLYCPERVWCSRMSTKYGFGSIGMSFFRPSLYAQYMAELDDCVKYHRKWNPIYNENGYNKALPSAYKRYLLQNYFQFKYSELAQYIFQANFLERHPDCFRNVAVEIPDPNDPFGILTTIGLEPRYIKMFRNTRERKRNSISCLPKKESEEMRYIEWDPVGVDAFERYLRFSDEQTQLWIDSVCVGVTNDFEHMVELKDDTTLMPVITTEWQTLAGFMGSLCDLRHKNLQKCAEIRKKAIERKHRHERHNQYV